MNPTSEGPSEDSSHSLPVSPRTNYKIYVGGISSQMQAGKLKAYFGSFGWIESVLTFNKKTRRVAVAKDNKLPPPGTSGLNYERIKGFCIVNAGDSATFERILNHSPHILNGRTIQCSEYITGSKLGQANVEKNSRRVIVKNVPPTITDDELKEILESYAGPIEIFFCFQTDNRKLILKGKQKKNKTFSVMFKDKRSIQTIEENPHLLLPDGSSIFLRKFSHRKEKYSNMATEASKEVHAPLQSQAVKSFSGQSKNSGGAEYPLQIHADFQSSTIAPGLSEKESLAGGTEISGPSKTMTKITDPKGTKPWKDGEKSQKSSNIALKVRQTKQSNKAQTSIHKGTFSAKTLGQQAETLVLIQCAEDFLNLHGMKPTSSAYFQGARSEHLLPASCLRYRVSTSVRLGF